MISVFLPQFRIGIMKSWCFVYMAALHCNDNGNSWWNDALLYGIPPASATLILPCGTVTGMGDDTDFSNFCLWDDIKWPFYTDRYSVMEAVQRLRRQMRIFGHICWEVTYNAHEVTFAVLSHHFLPAILVRDHWPQTSTQHNESGVCGLSLPGRQHSIAGSFDHLCKDRQESKWSTVC